MRQRQRNDEERRQWVLNDEGLYRWYIAEKNDKGGCFPRHKRSADELGGIAGFVRRHRAEIDAIIDNVQSGAKPAHYLVYGG
jgi:hypothetical protein